MRIVNIIQRYPPAVGGSEIWCQETSRYLAKKGHKVKVLSLNINKEEEYWRDPLDEDRTVAFGCVYFDEGVIVRRYKRSLSINLFHCLSNKLPLDKLLNVNYSGPHSTEMYGKMWKEIKRADIVFLHTIPYPHNYIAFFIAKLLRKKTVIVPHFHPEHPHYERSTNYWLLRNCDGVITVTDYEKKYLEAKGISGKKLYVTGNSIYPAHYKPEALESFRKNMEQKYGLGSNDRVITFIGRKIPDKGVEHLIMATKALLAEMSLKLFLVGPSNEWFNKLYNELSDKEKIHIIDVGMLSHQDKVNLLHMSDLMVLPSKYEAFGIVFLESWICGVPVLGTTEGAMPDVIGDEGYLCRFGDTEDLKSTIRQALNDINGSKEKGIKGKSKVLNNYTWDIIGQKTEKAISTVFGKKKIIFCCNSYPPHFIGGAELIAHAQAKVLKKLGHDVLIFAGELNDSRKRYSVKKDSYKGLPVYRVCLHSKDLSYDFFNFAHEAVEDIFDNLLNDYSPDIVHFHNIIGLSAGLIQVAKKRAIRTVMTLHDYWGICHKNTLMKEKNVICKDTGGCDKCQTIISGNRWRGVPSRMRKDFIALQISMVDNFISPSNYLASTYKSTGLIGDNISAIPNGIDIKRFSTVKRKLNNKKVRFSFVGYLGEHKGVKTIIEALEYVENKKYVTVNLVGDGALIDELKDMVKERGLEDLVSFHGKIDNSRIESIYVNTDVLILPSLWPENEPVSITEAMASSIPVIASRIGGIPEFVDDENTGYLFEPGNAKELAEKMSEFIVDSTKINEFGKNGFKKISGYTIETQVEKILGIYNSNQTTNNNTSSEDALILCYGKNMSSECADAIKLFSNDNEKGFRFIMAEWLNKEQLSKATLLWIVDRDVTPEEITQWLFYKLPLLVPEGNDKLKQLCNDQKCGLYYRDALEASVCIEYLARDDVTNKAIGLNSFRSFYQAG